MCGRYGQLNEHHIFGASNRKKSTKYKLTVNLCVYCHTETPNGVHVNSENMLKLKQMGQRLAMQENGWDTKDFIAVIGKNYL